MRGIARRIASSVGVAACFLLCVGCEGEPAGCQGFCENAEGVDCLDTSVDECLAECREFEAEIPDECRSAWNALSDCAAEGEWTCEAGTCVPSEGEECESVPVLHGCTEEAEAFEACGPGGDDCAEAEGAGTDTLDGRIVQYDYSSTCQACDAPPLTGAPPGAECARASDCEQYCCDCPEGGMFVQVCIDGFCASEAEACDDSLGACTGFH